MPTLEAGTPPGTGQRQAQPKKSVSFDAEADAARDSVLGDDGKAGSVTRARTKASNKLKAEVEARHEKALAGKRKETETADMDDNSEEEAPKKQLTSALSQRGGRAGGDKTTRQK